MACHQIPCSMATTTLPAFYYLSAHFVHGFFNEHHFYQPMLLNQTNDTTDQVCKISTRYVGKDGARNSQSADDAANSHVGAEVVRAYCRNEQGHGA
jgi:hypothetical protein